MTMELDDTESPLRPGAEFMSSMAVEKKAGTICSGL